MGIGRGAGCRRLVACLCTVAGAGTLIPIGVGFSMLLGDVSREAIMLRTHMLHSSTLDRSRAAFPGGMLSSDGHEHLHSPCYAYKWRNLITINITCLNVLSQKGQGSSSVRLSTGGGPLVPPPPAPDLQYRSELNFKLSRTCLQKQVKGDCVELTSRRAPSSSSPP